jgi:uncharacterized protein YraI
MLTVVLAVAGTLAAAQALDLPPGTTVRVANTDGTELNLRAGPSTSEVIVARLVEGSPLTVTGPARAVGDIRWLPARDAAGHNGWIDGQYVAVVSVPAASPTPTATPLPLPTEAPYVESPGYAAVAAPSPTVGPLEVEARLKFPETSGRDQEITVWVMRDGVPVTGAIVTVLTEDGELPFDRPLAPTDEAGRTRHAFDIRHEKGTVSLVVKATAPDGGEGTVSASYFRR